MIITIGRKPFKGSLIDNVKIENCGGLNIEDTRIGTEGGRTNKGGYQNQFVGGTVDYAKTGVLSDHTPRGRWGANFIVGTLKETAPDPEKTPIDESENISRYFKNITLHNIKS